MMIMMMVVVVVVAVVVVKIMVNVLHSIEQHIVIGTSIYHWCAISAVCS